MKKFLKENLGFMFFSLLITAIAVVPFFFSGIYRGADLQFHLSRFDGILTAIADKQFPLALYPYKNFGFGYPSPLFYSDTFLIVPAILRGIIGLPLVTTYKIFVAICVFVTVFSLMYCINRMVGHRTSAICASVLFVLCNYYQTDLFVRCALGEIIVFMFLPWLIFNIYRFIYERKNNFIVLGMLFAAIANAHIITFVLSVVLFGVFLLLNYKIVFRKERIICLAKAVLVGFGLAFSFLIPMVEQYTSQTLMVHKIGDTLMKTKALTPLQLFSDFFTLFNLNYYYETAIENVDATKSLGVILTFAPLLMIFARNKSLYQKHFLYVFLGLMVCSTSLIPLYKIELLGFIQFPSRMYILASVLSCFLIAPAFNSKKCSRLLLNFLILFSVWNVSYLHSMILNEQFSYVIPENATVEDLFVNRLHAHFDPSYSLVNVEEVENAEYLPANWVFNYQKASKCIVFEVGTDAICQYIRNGSYFDFYTDFDQNYRIMLPVTWYKGYAIYEIDEDYNYLKQLSVWSNELTNQLSMEAEAGHHHYVVFYQGTRIQKYSMIITTFTAFAILLYIGWNRLQLYSIEVSKRR